MSFVIVLVLLLATCQERDSLLPLTFTHIVYVCSRFRLSELMMLLLLLMMLPL